MARSEFQFWRSSAWRTATNQTFNAVIGFSITDRLNNPKSLELTLNNAADNPFGASSATQKGPFAPGQTNAISEFQQCRVVDTDTGNILFYGKIYRLTDEFDMKYGQVLRIFAYDNLKELADYPTDDKTTGFALKNQKRSDIIKDVINSTSQIDSLRISTDNITTLEANGLDDSNRGFANNEASGSVYLNVGKKRGLGGILEIAKADSHQPSGAEKTFGYDYYLSDLFDLATSSGDHVPPQAFNYFQRGSRPDATISGSTGAITLPAKADFKGLRLEYPTSEFTETGLYRLMLMDYSFDRSGEELYTDAMINTSEKQNTYDPSTGKTQQIEQRRHLRCELLKVDFGSVSDQEFQWEGKALSSIGKEGMLNSEVSEVMQAYSGGAWRNIGRIQYQSAKQDDGFILVSYEIGESHDTNMDTYLHKNNHSTVSMRGAITGDTCTITPSSGRMSNTHNLRRTYRVDGGGIDQTDGLRRKMAAALTKSATVSIKGGVRMLRTPHTYVDTTIDSITSATVAVLNQINSADIDTYGFKIGMTIAKIDSSGIVTAYGYASAITDNTVTATLNTGNWTGYSGAVRLYMPVKAGHYMHVTNRLQNVEGYHFINESIYSEGENIATTQFNTLSTQSSDNTTIGIGLPPGAISSAITSTVAPIGDITDVGFKTALNWTLIPDSGNTTDVVASTDYNTITVGASILSVGNGQYTYDISAHTIDVTTDHTIIYFDDDVSTTTFQSAVKQSYLKENNHIVIGWAYASADENSSSRAVLQLGTGVIGSAGIVNISAGNTNQDIDVTGVANDSITAAHLKASARPWASNLRWTGTAWNAIKWDNGSDNTDATLEFGNGDAITITDGATTGLTANTTHYFYVSGSLANGQTRTVSNSTNYTVPLGDSVVLLAIVTVGANSQDGSKPNILPFNSKEPTLNAVSIAADSITTDMLQASSVVAGKITVNDLESVSANMGSLTSGRGIFGVSTGNFNSGASGAGSGFTGVAMGEPGTGTNGIGTDFTLRAQVDGDDQVYIKSGLLYAGAGNVLIDALGINIAATTDGSNTRGLRFKAADPTGTTLVLARVNPSDATQFQWVGGGGLDEMVFNDINLSGIGSLQTTDDKYMKLPDTSSAEAGDRLEISSGSGTQASPYITTFADTKITINQSSASPTEKYGVFRYAKDGNENANDTLAFTHDHQNSTPASDTAQSVFWIMQSIGNFLHFEPNLAYGTSNYAWIGNNNPLVGVRGYYLQAGNGTAANPSMSFYANYDNGFWHDTSAGTGTISMSLGGTNEYLWSGSYFRSLTDADLGSSSARWGTVYAVSTDLSSDIRLKENIVNMTNGLDIVNALKPIEYTRIPDESKTQHFGFSAQHVKEVMLRLGYGENTIYSEEYSEEKDDTNWGIKLPELIAPLVSAIQELSEKIKKLEEEK